MEKLQLSLLRIIKAYYKYILIICFLFLRFISLNEYVLADKTNNIVNNSNSEHKFITYINNISSETWCLWLFSYIKNIKDSHDRLYLQAQKNDKQQYFKASEIIYRPLIVWFVFKDKTFSEPVVLISSGSKLYDTFNCNVIKQSNIPDFPEDKKRLLMFEGNLDEFINYLKKQGVLPPIFDVCKPINPFQIKLDKI